MTLQGAKWIETTATKMGGDVVFCSLLSAQRGEERRGLVVTGCCVDEFD